MESNDSLDKRYWYVRHKGRITGPFSRGLIRRQVLLGRIGNQDEFSHDQVSWKRLVHFPDLVPAVMNLDPDDPISRERLDAARRWADDREYKQRPILSQSESLEQRQGGVVLVDAPKLSENLIKKFSAIKRTQFRNKIFSFLLVTLFFLAAGLYINKTDPVVENAIDCSAEPAPGVNWNNCFMQGISLVALDLHGAQMGSADLVGANLSQANISGGSLSYALLTMVNAESINLSSATLVGASFRGANLSQANFRDADLSYASFLSANISGADFTGAKLGNARWVDGRICARGSITVCK